MAAKGLEALALRLGVDDFAGWLEAHTSQLRALVLADATELPDMPFAESTVGQLRDAARTLADMGSELDHWTQVVRAVRAKQAEDAARKAEQAEAKAKQDRIARLQQSLQAMRDLQNEARALGVEVPDLSKVVLP